MIAYGIAWLSRWVPILPEEAATILTARFWVTWGVLTVGSLLSAAGEEIGWRGLLVPLLNRRYGFGTAVLISGLIWAGWHYPLMLTVRYSANSIPAWYALIVFTLGVVGFSVFLGWLRLRSKSLWPAALAHASFNLALDIADGMTATNPMRGYLLGESGILLAGAMIVVGLVFWLLRRRLPPALTSAKLQVFLAAIKQLG
jgi:membrane protease YdiL (CAAX protease family)